jgi:DNA polymerase-3 subunit alpha
VVDINGGMQMNTINSNYVVYHLHSDLSNGVTNIDSVTKYKEYVDYAKSLGMTAMAFSEHGSIFEWVHKKEAIESAGMKYLHCVEAYLTKDTDIENRHRDNYHCVLIAKNYDGVKELNKLISNSFNRSDHHFYYAPRITFEELFNTSNNIIVTTACIGGVLGKGELDTKKRFVQFLVTNKDRCYLEIQHHNCKEQAEYNKIIYAISEKIGIPLIAGTDTHCLNDAHIEGRKILQRSKNVFFSDEEGWDLTFKTYDELIDAYDKQNALPKEIYMQAIQNTNVMADSVESFELDYSKKYPKLYNDSEKALREKIVKGIKNRGISKYNNFEEYKKKIQYEIETYKHNGAIDFLLLEEDYKTALKKQGVSFGYSRGSVSGSIIAYLLGITEVDSIKYNLNFER